MRFASVSPMTPETWTAVDRYLTDALVPSDPSLEAVLAANAAAGLPAIDVSPLQGKLLYLLTKLHAPRRVLEIGTLGGYSTLWLARALPPEARITTLELDPRHADVARRNFERTGVADRIDVIVGPALESLPRLQAPFDLVFIDADKVNTAEYYRWARQLTRPGALILVDNVVRTGELVSVATRDERVQGMRRFLEAISRDPGVEGTGLQTVGQKGYDGFVLARVR
jgi:predicted O-methyltransferase YrrM